MVAPIRKMLRHLLSPPWRVRALFPPAALKAIEEAIRDSETTHEGQICFAVESALEWGSLLRDESARERAVEVFSRLRVWDTEHNNGALIYLLLAERDVEIVVDRGLHHRLAAEDLERICRSMEERFREGRFQEGAIAGIGAVAAHLARHYPRRRPGPNELSDRPILL